MKNIYFLSDAHLGSWAIGHRRMQERRLVRFLDSIKDSMEDDEYLIIACRSFESGLDKAYDHITLKKIPQMLLSRCEFGKTDYNLNIVHPPVYEDEEDIDE